MSCLLTGYVCNIFIILMCMSKLECLPTGSGDKGPSLNDEGTRHGHKRSVYSTLPSSLSVQHLINATSMVCNDAMTYPYARMVELNDDQMREILQDKGGHYVRDYMASTQEEAIENFPNMLILMPATTIPGDISNFSMIDNLLTKNLILTDLQKLTNYFMTTNKTDMTSSNQNGGLWETLNANGSNGNNTSSELFKSVTTTTENSQELDLSKTTASALASNVTSSPTPYKIPPKPDTTGNVKSTETVLSPDINNYPTVTPAPSDFTTTIDPEVQRGLDQMIQYANGGLSKRDLDHVWRESQTVLHPAVLIDLDHQTTRRKRNTDGSSTREEYCQLRGHLTEDGKFKHLCSMCAATTKLADNIFPRYINEVVCKTGDTDCFTVSGTAHGQCKQTKFSMNMLRKTPDVCKMVLHGGETLVFEDWELTPMTIRVSCECTINKLSVFSPYVGQDTSVPVG